MVGAGIHQSLMPAENEGGADPFVEGVHEEGVSLCSCETILKGSDMAVVSQDVKKRLRSRRFDKECLRLVVNHLFHF